MIKKITGYETTPKTDNEEVNKCPKCGKKLRHCLIEFKRTKIVIMEEYKSNTLICTDCNILYDKVKNKIVKRIEY